MNFLKGYGTYLGGAAMLCYGLAILFGCCEGDQNRAMEMILGGLITITGRRAIGNLEIK